MNRIDKKFKELRRRRRKAFIAFVTAGYPSFRTTEELVIAFEKAGVSIVELGVPFSDPIADGPVIQRASQEALKKGATLKKVLDLTRRLRARTQIPLAAMTYFNPILAYGPERFVDAARTAGLDGLIIPDLPPEEEKDFARRARRAGLAVISFVAPTTSVSRSRLIARGARGFIYFVSLTGVTGARRRLPPGLKGQVRALKRMAPRTPVCVGFGVSSAGQAGEVARWSDGVIVGSAIIKKITENKRRPDLVKRVARFVSGLISKSQ